jgi:glycosyltransferase involved in cell wall biosynthesis
LGPGDARLRLGLLGPAWPFRGGIAHHTTLLARALAARHDLRFVGFRRMYPPWLYPGASDREPGGARPADALDEPILDSANPATWLAAGRRLAAFRPDAVVIPWWVAFWAPQIYVVSRVLRRAGVPVIFLCHNVREHESSPLRAAVTRRALRAGSAFLCHTDAEAALLRERFPGRIVRKIAHPTYGALSGGGGEVAAGRDAAKELLFFGFVRDYKGLDVLLAAMPEVRDRTGARLRVVGECWGDPAPLRRRVGELGLTETVDLDLRYVANEEIPGLFARAAIVVLPYRSATGCGPLQLAFGAGRPVVGSAVGAIAEAVRDGEDGLLVPPGDPAALAAALIRALEPGLLARLTRGAAESAAAFSWERLVDAIGQVVGELGGGL